MLVLNITSHKLHTVRNSVRPCNLVYKIIVNWKQGTTKIFGSDNVSAENI